MRKLGYRRCGMDRIPVRDRRRTKSTQAPGGLRVPRAGFLRVPDRSEETQRAKPDVVFLRARPWCLRGVPRHDRVSVPPGSLCVFAESTEAVALPEWSSARKV